MVFVHLLDVYFFLLLIRSLVVNLITCISGFFVIIMHKQLASVLLSLHDLDSHVSARLFLLGHFLDLLL